jgi:NADH-ubiquinone oxidoreductase chain 1
MVVISIMLFTFSYSFNILISLQEIFPFIILFLPISFIWVVIIIAETNRTPFDFAEGESELVSGFNIEYGGGGFALIFMAEYASILFMSCLYCIFFIGNYYFLGVGITLISFLFI